jgi:hypothetical protein
LPQRRPDMISGMSLFSHALHDHAMDEEEELVLEDVQEKASRPGGTSI